MPFGRIPGRRARILHPTTCSSGMSTPASAEFASPGILLVPVPSRPTAKPFPARSIWLLPTVTPGKYRCRDLNPWSGTRTTSLFGTRGKPALKASTARGVPVLGHSNIRWRDALDEQHARVSHRLLGEGTAPDSGAASFPSRRAVDPSHCATATRVAAAGTAALLLLSGRFGVEAEFRERGADRGLRNP